MSSSNAILCAVVYSTALTIPKLGEACMQEPDRAEIST